MKTKYNLPVILLFFFCSLTAVSQPPSWVSYESRKQAFPDGQYLTGFSSQPVRKGEDPKEILGMLSNSARTQLIESISISIRSEATLTSEVNNLKASEIFKQAMASSSQAELSGFKSEQYYDPKKKEAYAFAYVRIPELLESNRNALTSESAQLEKKIELAKQYAKSGDNKNAVKTYYECFLLLRQMEARLSLLATLGHESRPEKISELENTVNQGVSEVRSGSHSNLEDVSFFIADGLKQQLPPKFRDYPVRMGSFTYMNTRMGSDLSVRLSSSLESQLIKEGFTIQQPQSAGTMPENLLLAAGTWWPESQKLKIIINLSDPSSGKIIASAEDFIPMDWISQQKISYVPENLEAALKLEKELNSGEIANVGLDLRLWTNKGNNNPVYRNGEKMQVYVQVNQPCFIRLIYYFADGSKVLLQDSRFIDEDKVNKPYLIPATFECAPPFGAEVLQLVAQTEQFAPLKTRAEEGYDFIVDSDKVAIATTRGMKREKPAMLIGEKRVNVTTLEK